MAKVGGNGGAPEISAVSDPAKNPERLRRQSEAAPVGSLRGSGASEPNLAQLVSLEIPKSPKRIIIDALSLTTL
jgi:hypothetical protein